jgi:hypothetical protein
MRKVKEIAISQSEHGGTKKPHELERTRKEMVSASGVKRWRTGRYVREGATSHVTDGSGQR